MTSTTQTFTTQDIHHTRCKLGHPPHQTSTTPDIHRTRNPSHHVMIWCGGCPILHTMWCMSGVVDVWCGGCPVWSIPSVVDVLFYTWFGESPVWWMSSLCGGCYRVSWEGNLPVDNVKTKSWRALAATTFWLQKNISCGFLREVWVAPCKASWHHDAIVSFRGLIG